MGFLRKIYPAIGHVLISQTHPQHHQQEQLQKFVETM